MKRLLLLLTLLALAPVQAKRPQKRQDKTLLYLSFAMMATGGGYLVYDKYFVKRWRRIQMNTPSINQEFAFWDEDVQGLRAPKVPYIPGRAGSDAQLLKELHEKHLKDVADYRLKIQDNDLMRKRKIARGEMSEGRAKVHREIEIKHLRALERLTHTAHRKKAKVRLKQSLEQEYERYKKDEPTLTFSEFKKRQKDEFNKPIKPKRQEGDEEDVVVRVARLSEVLPKSVQESLRNELNVEEEEEAGQQEVEARQKKNLLAQINHLIKEVRDMDANFTYSHSNTVEGMNYDITYLLGVRREKKAKGKEQAKFMRLRKAPRRKVKITEGYNIEGFYRLLGTEGKYVKLELLGQNKVLMRPNINGSKTRYYLPYRGGTPWRRDYTRTLTADKVLKWVSEGELIRL